MFFFISNANVREPLARRSQLSVNYSKILVVNKLTQMSTK